VLGTPELAAQIDVFNEADEAVHSTWLAEADVATIVAWCEDYGPGRFWPAVAGHHGRAAPPVVW
jgi:hypothetical protein